MTSTLTAFSGRNVLISLAAIVLAFGTAALLLAVVGQNPFQSFVGLASTAVGSTFAIGTTLLYAVWNELTWSDIAFDAWVSEPLAWSDAVASGAAPETAWSDALPVQDWFILLFRFVTCVLIELCSWACCSVIELV